MAESPDLWLTKIPLHNGAGDMPALGFGTLIPDAAVTTTATKDALEAGFRHFDCAERYRNEREVGEALQAGLGRCPAIGLSDVGLKELLPVYESARIKPAVIPVESHPYLPETELLEFCRAKSIVLLAFAPLGHGMKPGLLEDPVITAIAARVKKTPAQVLLAWAVQRGTALLTTPKTAARERENFDISPLPEDALNEINGIQTRQRLNPG